jgi:dolichol-phosphate mannosyltransferase
VRPDTPDISYVIPVYNEEQALPALFAALEDVLGEVAQTHSVEVILVDDGSRDQSWELIAARAASDPRYHGIRLSRNFGHQVALSCGYHFARGAAVISMDADLQDPPAVTLRMIAEWEQGADIVFAVRARRAGETWFKLMTARLFYWLIEHLGDVSVPRDSGDFRLLSRRALDALNTLPERHRYIRGLAGWVGYRTATLTYQRDARVAGTTKYPFKRMLRLAIDAIVSMSFTPLRLAYLFGIVLALPFLVYLAYNLVLLMMGSSTILKGWSSLILAVIVFGAANLMFIGIMGEYVGRIYEEVKRRPLYLVQEKTNPARREGEQ